jgi:hypothetical protein
MYYVVFVRDPSGKVQSGSVVGKAITLAEAKSKRMVSGDLVFRENGHIEPSLEWLWEAEKKDEFSYAQKCIKKKYFFPGRFPRIEQ